jgi:hypothetical protein
MHDLPHWHPEAVLPGSRCSRRRRASHPSAKNGVFCAWTIAGPAAKLKCLPDERRGMALFRRKATLEDEPERCPVCRERLPDDADECAMCGADLKPLRPSYERDVGEPVERD